MTHSSDKLHRSDAHGETRYLFWCPGCDRPHHFVVPKWSFDGDWDSPTFSPSLLTDLPKGHPDRCHLYVRNGKIEYLSDCGHELAGETVDMVTMPGGQKDE